MAGFFKRGQSQGTARRSWPIRGTCELLCSSLWTYCIKGPTGEAPTPSRTKRLDSLSSWSRVVFGWVRDPRQQPGISPSPLKQESGSREPSGKNGGGWVKNEEWKSLRERHEKRGRRKLHNQRDFWDQAQEGNRFHLRGQVWWLNSGPRWGCWGWFRLSAKVYHDWLVTSATGTRMRCEACKPGTW